MSAQIIQFPRQKSNFDLDWIAPANTGVQEHSKREMYAAIDLYLLLSLRKNGRLPKRGKEKSAEWIADYRAGMRRAAEFSGDSYRTHMLKLAREYIDRVLKIEEKRAGKAAKS